jgi:hypothetical protein
MIVTSIAPDAKRDAAAALLAQTAPWPRVTLTRQYGAFGPGTTFYRVPSRSQAGQRHMANAVACECADYQKNGAICAHVRAVLLVEANLTDVTHDDLNDPAHDFEVELAFADVARCRSCGERTAGTHETFCRACRRRLLQLDDD